MQSSYDVFRKQRMTQNLQFHHSTVKDVFATQESPVEAAYRSTRALGTTSKYSSSPDRDPGLKYGFVGTTQTKHNRETNGGAEQCNILRSVSHFFRLFQQKVSLQNELMAETNLTLTFGNFTISIFINEYNSSVIKIADENRDSILNKSSPSIWEKSANS